MNRSERWYFVCDRCDAKWFQPWNVGICPRCGQAAESRERMIPPWVQQRGPPEGTEEHLQPTINVSSENQQ